ncbi:EI24 domain-containing protein [Aquimarina sp. MMG015]|uniref:EI24 domain-containing protein n=1 Tax=unclassified Aquimarina TaxID=2627091 RepID=UPI000D55D384|nr:MULTISPECIES: EI24 domain-containing protein [unclassified Aquimarina]AXT57430.1 coproporphyrinogen III oxidase [Aquimarina sp. AD1]MBQ4801314.1 EI24 domain-containing protein [Aquimarina sp. MMG015]RKN32754.1 coproporphyrinogen III oxidase [Aquimarina sp. AD1]
MIKNIINGIKAYFGGFALISKLGLWKYFGIPILISFLTGILFVTLAWFLSDPLGSVIAKAWVWDWGSETFTVISKYFSILLILALGLVLYKHIVMALSAPFMSPVSEKVEAHLLGDKHANHEHRNTSFRQQLMRGIRINVRNLFRELLFIIPLLILSIIPVIGILATILIFAVQAYYVGFGNIDYTMERHFKYKDSIEFVRKNRGTAIGNGIVFMLMLFIPIIGFIITLPISVVAASSETVKILDREGLIKVDTQQKVSKIEA